MSGRGTTSPGGSRAKSFDGTLRAPTPLGSRSASLSPRSGNASEELYKTELCHAFESTGHCKYGLKCRFAHGKSELRPVNRHPKYKTQQCKSFRESGHCPYGARCKFIHDEVAPASAPAQLEASGDDLELVTPRLSGSLTTTSAATSAAADPGPPRSANNSGGATLQVSTEVSTEVSPRVRDTSPMNMSPFGATSPRSPEIGRQQRKGGSYVAGFQSHRAHQHSRPPRRVSAGELQIGLLPRKKEDRLPIFQDIAGKE